GPHFAQRAGQRKYGRHRAISYAGIDVDLALIDRNTDVFASAIETPIAPTALLVGVALVELMLREDAVRNAQHFDFDARHVHRFDGDAVRFRTRQDHAAAGKADISGAVAEGE